MSALGQKQTLAPQKAMFALPLKADMCRHAEMSTECQSTTAHSQW